MNGFFYTVTYSFDCDRHAVGPFPTWESAWAAMLKNAQNEEHIDRDENGWAAQLCADKDAGEITLSNSFSDRTDVTTWLLFEGMEVV
jgi:hypothetical protein